MVQDKVGLKKFSPKNFFLQEALKFMCDGEIVKKIFPLKKILDFENFWSKTGSKTKLDLENFHQKFFLQKALKCHV